MVFHLWDHAARMEANRLDPEAPSLFTAQIADDGFCYVSQNHLITASWGNLLPIHICFPAHGHDIKNTISDFFAHRDFIPFARPIKAVLVQEIYFIITVPYIFPMDIMEAPVSLYHKIHDIAENFGKFFLIPL